MKNHFSDFDFPMRKVGIYEKYIKRGGDIIISGFAIAVLSPVFLVLAIIVRLKLGRPIFFRQKRIGKNETVFSMIKFRSMKDGKDASGRMLPDSERLTKFGRVLRSTSLDELPELINIFKGDMSLIGPRPLPEVYLPYYFQSERIRHSLRGGMTGLAQVNGRNSLSWEQRFELDAEYANNISFKLDMRIFGKTILKVIKRSDIGERGVSTPEDLDDIREVQPWYESMKGRKP